MNRLDEKVKLIPLIAPTTQSAGGSTSSAVVDISSYSGIIVAVLCGVIESGKKLTVTVSQSDSSDMTDSETLETLTLDGDGTTADNSAECFIPVTARAKRYIKITAANTCATNGVTLTAIGAAGAKFYPFK